MIRSGRMDATVIGAIQINEAGDLANWALPGQRCFRTRGSNGSGRWSKRGDRCDISYGKNGRHKLVKDCTVPLTGRKSS